MKGIDVIVIGTIGISCPYEDLSEIEVKMWF